MGRECGDCTKCCEGFLTATVRGFKMGELIDGNVHTPKPCPFVAKDKGCKQYLLRPKDPCKTFKCEWKANEHIPEHLKPNMSKTIPVMQNTPGGIRHLALIEAGETLHSEVLSWYITYVMEHRINFVWRVDGFLRWMGHPDFLREMEAIYVQNNITKAP